MKVYIITKSAPLWPFTCTGTHIMCAMRYEFYCMQYGDAILGEFPSYSCNRLQSSQVVQPATALG